MNSTDLLTQFNIIEHKIDQLIKRCSLLEAENKDYAGKIMRLEQEIAVKTETENHHIEESRLIQSKINNLLLKIKGIKNIDE